MILKKLSLLFLGIGVLLLLSSPSFGQYWPYYVLDGYGGIHSGGGAATISPKTPYFGWDIARAIQYVPVGYTSTYYGHGILVLDGYGGIHQGGELSALSVSKTPYFGWDIARDMALRLIPPKANYSSYSCGNVTVTSTSYISMRSTYLYLPDDGYVFISGSVSMGNNDTTNDSHCRVAIGVDSSTTELHSIESEECFVAKSNMHNWRTVTKSQMAFCTAGYHTFYFIVKKSGTSGQVLYFDPTISAIYIDMSCVGYSEKPDVSTPGPEDRGTGSNIR